LNEQPPRKKIKGTDAYCQERITRKLLQGFPVIQQDTNEWEIGIKKVLNTFEMLQEENYDEDAKLRRMAFSWQDSGMSGKRK
jgi:hypothetical protein